MKNERSPLKQTLSITPLSSQLLAGAIIGFSVFFILAVFQPFGTYGFQMRHKILFLAGYGALCTVTYAGYYALTMYWLKKWYNPTRWNVVRELATLIPVVIAMSMAALYYHHAVIGGYSIHLGDIIYFLKISLAVGIVPFSILFYIKWSNSRTITVESNGSTSEVSITFESNNKKEKPVTIQLSDLIYVKSNGNYIEIKQRTEKGVKAHMIRKSLNQVEGRLPETLFLKLHRSYIVNVALISDLSLRGSSYVVKISQTDIEIPVSRTMVREVRVKLEKA
jgi:hypothetical protein